MAHKSEANKLVPIDMTLAFWPRLLHQLGHERGLLERVGVRAVSQ
jgi:hypothetical protein